MVESFDLSDLQKLIYSPLNLTLTNCKAEKESREYSASTFQLNELWIKFRAAKVTPTKTGLFVTLWKRNEAGITCPHDVSDQINYFIISVRKHEKFGHFVFPKAVLLERGILSTETKEGKRGFRVYPPWDEGLNKQALKTQTWQLDFFMEVKGEGFLDLDRAKKLYS
jgi:hypothetical protein